jgi:sugar phosphate isomerase/epimerase
MKYAFMSFSTPHLSLEQMLKVAADYGYAGIEPRIASGHAHGIEPEAPPEVRRVARRLAEDTGVELCCIAAGHQYADPEQVERAVEQTRRTLALAADVGAPRIRVFGGALPSSVPRADAIAGVAEALRSLADEALTHGVTICLETHDDWTDPEHVAAVMRLVDHPAVAMNWDYQHTTRVAGKAVVEAFAALQPWIRHVHFHDGANRADKLVFLPVGQGDFDNRAVLALLHGARYDGFLSGEWINWESYEVHLPREIAAMRALEPALA